MRKQGINWGRRCAVGVLLASCGAAWAALPAPHDGSEAAPATAQALWTQGKNDCKPLAAGDSSKLGIIRQMLQGGKPHAAIAYLDAAAIKAPQADLLRADGLRKTGRRAESDALYRQLTGSCVAGYAYQGLGLNASEQGKLAEAVRHLRAASAALPVDAAIRNDYGYALMSSGEREPALHEFLTAIELAPDHKRAAHNLVLLLTRNGDDAKAAAFAQRYGISADELEALRQLAGQPLAKLDEALPALEPKPAEVVALPHAAPPEMETEP